MLTAFVHSPDGVTRKVDSVDAVRAAWQQPDVRVWVDLETPEEAELRALREVFHLDEEALQDCLQGEQWPRIDDFDAYIFLVLYGLFGLKERGDVDPHKLAVFCGPRFLITVHREPLLTVRLVKARCGRHPESVIARGVDYTLCTIIDLMVDNYLRVAERYEQRLDALEDQSFRPDVDETLLSGLAELRRDLLELRRLAASQQELLRPLMLGEYDFVSGSLSQQFQHVRDHLSQVIDTVNGLRELLGGVYNNYHSVLTGRTNEIMKLLTIFAGILLPLTLIAGIYGMNLEGLPAAKHPMSFWWVLGGMAGIALILYWSFRRRKWL
ncbi:MAG TPA: magnesium transporter CorA family protein [Isosphaeraceae bacterium]|jgi:magnesium transporter